MSIVCTEIGRRPAPAHGTRLAALAGLFLLGTTSGCADRPLPSGPRLVVLYSTCTVNKEFLSPYGPAGGGGAPVDFTPHLARFAERGTVFERHNTETGQSGVAFASLYSGLQADRHGVYHHPRPLAEELYLVTEAFRDNGYRPYFWSGQPMAAAELRYGQGVAEEDSFDTHIMFTKTVEPLPPGFLAATTGTGPQLDEVLARLVDDPEAGAFLQLNFTITHELYHQYADLEEIERFRAAYPAHATDFTRDEIAATLELFEQHRHALQLDHPNARRELGLDDQDVARLDAVLQLAYKACIAQLDRYFGEFVDRIEAAGLLEDSLIAFTADHGETFFHESEPLHWMHGLQLAPSVIDVPWILFGPSAGVPAGRYEAVTRSVDVFPTLVGLAGGRLPDGLELDGVDLSESVRGKRSAPRLLAYSHTSTLGEARVKRYRREGHDAALSLLPAADPRHVRVRVRDRDLIWELRRSAGQEGVTPACFDLAADPRRTADLFDPDDATHAEMVEKLKRYRRRLIQHFDTGEEMSQQEILRRLEGLGYLGG